jgi:hypothetical protein
MGLIIVLLLLILLFGVWGAVKLTAWVLLIALLLALLVGYTGRGRFYR